MSAIDLTREDITLRFDEAERDWIDEKVTTASSYQREDGEFVIHETAEGWVASYTSIDLEAVR